MSDKEKMKYIVQEVGLERQPFQEAPAYIESLNGESFSVEGLKWEELTFTVKYVSSGDYSAITSDEIMSKFISQIKNLKLKCK